MFLPIRVLVKVITAHQEMVGKWGEWFWQDLRLVFEIQNSEAWNIALMFKLKSNCRKCRLPVRV